RAGKPTVTMNLYCHHQGQLIGGGAREGEKYSGLEHDCRSKKVQPLFRELAEQWGSGDLLVDSTTFEYRKGPIRKNRLQAIVEAAWCEAFGKPLPSAADREQLRQQARAGFLKLLRQGKKGVQEWNADSGRPLRAGHFRGVDLSGLNL